MRPNAGADIRIGHVGLVHGLARRLTVRQAQKDHVYSTLGAMSQGNERMKIQYGASWYAQDAL